jgi:hypothetical protein
LDQTAAGNGNVVIEQDKRIEAMDKELQIIKGSIKKLMIDIREEMNNSENPFLNLQQLQAPNKELRNMKIPASVTEAQIEEPEYIPEEIQEEAAQEEPEVQPKMAAREVKKAEARKRKEAVLEETEQADTEGPKMLLKQMKETIRDTDGYMPQRDAGRLDPETIIKLMQWTRTVLVKNGTVRFHNLLDAYVSMGYLSAETKNVIEKMSMLVSPDMEPIPKDIDIKECVGDMYSLFMVLNPRDKNLDSRMLCVMLGYEDRTLNIL